MSGPLLPHTIVAADWGDSPRKRRVVRVDMPSLTVSGVAPADGATLSRLLRLSPSAGTLIGVDAVIGIPRYVGEACGAAGFVDWLRHAAANGELFEAATRPEDWKPTRPFWRNPVGEGEQKRFFEVISEAFPAFPRGHRLRRSLEPPSAKPPTCVSGLPGSVGSGTRELWRELLKPGLIDGLAVWPFDGRRITGLLSGPRPVLVETYPALAYGLVLGDHLPARRQPLAKTVESVRELALDRLCSRVQWVRPVRIEGGLLQAAVASEDSFDALFLALALCRLALERRLDPEGEESADVEPHFEGGIVGTWCLTHQPEGEPRARVARSSGGGVRRGGGQVCPIPGCGFVFAMGRGGWDAHVASVRNHEGWHPEERDPERRKELFRDEYGDWLGLRRE